MSNQDSTSISQKYITLLDAVPTAYASPALPVGCAVCKANKVEYIPLIVNEVPSAPSAPCSPCGPCGPCTP